MILQLNIWCFKEGNEMTGEKDEDLWLPIAIDLFHVHAIKSNGEGNEFTGSDLAVFYIHNDRFICDMKYTEALQKWSLVKNATFATFSKPQRVFSGI
jgi:hypothetical protein